MQNFFSHNQQELVVYIYNHFPVCFKSQNIFTSKKFYQTINFLKTNELIIRCCFCGEFLPCKKKDLFHKKKDMREKYYKLTLEGELWALKFGGLK